METATDEVLASSLGASGLSLQERVDVCLMAGTPRLRLALARASRVSEQVIERLMQEDFPAPGPRRAMTPYDVRLAIDEATERSRRRAEVEVVDAGLALSSSELGLLCEEIYRLWTEGVPLLLGMDPLPLYNNRKGHGIEQQIFRLAAKVTPPNSGMGKLQRVSCAAAWWREKIQAFYTNPYFNGGRPGRLGSLEWLCQIGEADDSFYPYVNWHKFCAGHYYLEQRV